jgi:hypothetical protein
LLWELTRLSFVVDWFIPIGDFFNGLVPPQGVSVVNGHLTTVGTLSGSGTVLYNRPDKPGVIVEMKQSQNEKFKVRTSVSSFPRYHLVGATFDLSKQQVMSGLSLLWSFGTGRKSEAKAYNDAIALRSRAYQGLSGPSSREKWDHKGGKTPEYLFPRGYDRL